MNSSRSLNVRVNQDESIDDFMDGRVRLIQSRSGYRFSIDAILLSDFVTIKKGDLVVDLGTGCGIIPLILLRSKPVGFALGIEIQAELVDQAARNIFLNGVEDSMAVLQGDVRHPPFPPGSADVVVCNPPYRSTCRRYVPRSALSGHEAFALVTEAAMPYSPTRTALPVGTRLEIDQGPGRWNRFAAREPRGLL